MKFQTVSITPIDKGDGTTQYRVDVDCEPGTTNLWAIPGVHDSLEAVIFSFVLPLKEQFCFEILAVVGDERKPYSFSLENALELR